MMDNNGAFCLKIAGLIKNGELDKVENLFDEEIRKNPLNIELIHYATVFFNQWESIKKYTAGSPGKGFGQFEELLNFWLDEAGKEEADRAFEKIKEHARGLGIEGYPRDLNLELTTFCNSKCKFCTHESLTKEGKKPAKNMELKFAKYIINKFRVITKIQNIPEHLIIFNPTGLGETMLNPSYFEVIAYARLLFPKAYIKTNTNCIALTGELADKILASPLDSIMLSLCYNHPDTHKEQLGVDKYAVVAKNIKEFLKKKGNRPPRAAVHIFDDALNAGEMENFFKQWAPFINKNDLLIKHEFLSLTEWKYREGEKYPCLEPWSIMMVDIDGHAYPCCLGVWTDESRDLRIGHISDEPSTLLENLCRLRKRHLCGDFGICDCCAYLSEDANNNKIFHDRLRARYNNDLDRMAKGWV